ncbi:MAG: carboxypeptidase M32 [Rhodocyclaceae bacterium]|nr:carboxypeptidase M32 [Rhodocyclaceae bacterium]
MLAWDRATTMPPGGVAARAAAEAELQGLIQGHRSDPRLMSALKAAEQEPLDDLAQADVREMWRDWHDASSVPPVLAEARVLATARCEFAWREQRARNDWAGFLGPFREVLRLAREEAARLGEARGLDPYDALVDRFEPGMDAATLTGLFDSICGWLPSMLAAARVRQGTQRPPALPGGFPIAAQRALSEALMDVFGFDRQRGRLDSSAHPFTGGVAEDVRITTRYNPHDPFDSLNSTIHELGHARYAQGLPRAWLGRPVGRARSFGIHESQSLSFEMQIARSAAFASRLAPLLAQHLGPRPEFESEAVLRRLTWAEPGLIRVAADELSYPLHIVLRFRLERALISGTLEADDLPAAWDEGMAELLDLDTRGNYRDGCLQDIHWSKGAFGYFPSYTLGAVYAAQWFAALRRDLGPIEDRIASGDLVPIFDWLESRVWSQASRWETPELLQRGTGRRLDAEAFRRHLGERYLGGADDDVRSGDGVGHRP